MKLAVAQTRPTVGAVEQNVKLHLALIRLGVQHGANLIMFPELSLTGYEPSLATDVCRCSDDSSLAPIQQISDSCSISIGVGLPLRTSGLPRIANVLFRPNSTPRVYSKRYLHPDELPFFSCGTEVDSTIHYDPVVSLAICYELSIPEHSQTAFAAGAKAYIASVAKTARGVEDANQRLSDIAKKHSAVVMMSNCIGFLDGAVCVGSSAAWGRSGSLLAQLDRDSNGVVVVDYNTEEAVTDVLASQDQ
jgi:predicted amidohydrolase